MGGRYEYVVLPIPDTYRAYIVAGAWRGSAKLILQAQRISIAAQNKVQIRFLRTIGSTFALFWSLRGLTQP